MPRATLSAADFVRLYETEGAREVSRRTGVSERKVRARRARIEKTIGRAIVGPTQHVSSRGVFHPHRAQCHVESGIVLVGSDGHYWPGKASTAHRAFVRFCKELKPRVVVMNGDVLDGSTISRHPPLNWEARPTLIHEIEACKERLAEIEAAVPHSSTLVWTLGNHDSRFETRLATAAPEYARVHGVHLKDHFGSRWKPAWAAWVNETMVVKHKWKGGVHSVHNNTKDAGKTMVTGHDHALRVSPFTDYNGTRYGVSTGCLADPDGPQFDYSEDNPKNHRSGFAVFTFHKGRLLIPELVSVFGPDTVEFRGEVIRV